MKAVVSSALRQKNNFAYRNDTEGYLIYELLELIEEQQEGLNLVINELSYDQIEELITKTNSKLLQELTCPF